MDGVNEYRLQVGEIVKIKKGFFGKTLELIYAGMPTRDTYSVAVHGTEGYGSWAYNLFLHVDRKEFRAGNGRVLVMNVNEREICLRYVE